MQRVFFVGLLLATTIVRADPAEDAELRRLIENKIPAEVDAALNEAEEIVLQSISPKHGLNPFEKEPGPGDYPLLGEAKLDKKDRQRVLAAFRGAAADQAAANKRAGGVGFFGCFILRQALRLTDKGVRYDLLICFECANVRIYKDGEEFESVGIRNTDGKHSRVLNEVLTVAKIELAPPSKKASK
jgi:hypothetical protein